MLSLLQRACPLALVLSFLALPAVAAPVPTTGNPLPGLTKYLLDDTDGVFVFNLKAIRTSPIYAKGLKKQTEDLLVRPEVQAYLKDIGFDLLKDVDHVLFCSGRSCYLTLEEINKPGPTDTGSFLLFQGRFDPEKMKAKMEALSRETPPKVTISKDGRKKIYRLGRNGYGPHAAQLDATTVVIAGRRAHVIEALAKAAGKKTTRFAYKEVLVLLKKLKVDVAVQGFALESYITSSSALVKKGPKGKGVGWIKYHTLGDEGFKEAVLTVVAKDAASANLTFTVKDKAQFNRISDKFTEGFTEARMEAKGVAERDAKMMPLARFLDRVSIKNAGQTITLEGKADADAIQAFIRLYFGFLTRGPRRMLE